MCAENNTAYPASKKPPRVRKAAATLTSHLSNASTSKFLLEPLTGDHSDDDVEYVESIHVDRRPGYKQRKDTRPPPPHRKNKRSQPPPRRGKATERYVPGQNMYEGEVELFTWNINCSTSGDNETDPVPPARTSRGGVYLNVSTTR